MKIIWLGGIVLPKIAQVEGLPINNTNGWLISNSETIGAIENMELVYIFDSPKSIHGKNEYYSYYGIKCSGAVKKREVELFQEAAVKILELEQPDIIHIWGTERPHTIAMVNACERMGILNKVVISIQGLVSVCAQHYEANLPHYVVKGLTLKDILKGNIAKGKKNFYKAGKFEIEALKKVQHVIGRTDWDKACIWNINPKVNYHFNNETLRNEFYTGQWAFEKCEQHSMFCSQGNYPIKGIHFAIQALERIVKEYPDAKLYIGGKNYLTMPVWLLGSYGKYIRNLIKRLGLMEHVIFTGFLKAEEMKERYLRSNVFISSSSIENSPNSLGEAMLLGVPCVASDVGGVKNMLSDKNEGYLYPADESYMLSYYVCKIFENSEIAKQFSKEAREHALKTHNKEKNLKDMLAIYQSILTDGEM